MEYADSQRRQKMHCVKDDAEEVVGYINKKQYLEEVCSECKCHVVLLNVGVVYCNNLECSRYGKLLDILDMVSLSFLGE